MVSVQLGSEIEPWLCLHPCFGGGLTHDWPHVAGPPAASWPSPLLHQRLATCSARALCRGAQNGCVVCLNSAGHPPSSSAETEHIFMDWRPQDGARLHVVDLETGAVRVFETDPFFVFHWSVAVASRGESCLVCCFFSAQSCTESRERAPLPTARASRLAPRRANAFESADGRSLHLDAVQTMHSLTRPCPNLLHHAGPTPSSRPTAASCTWTPRCTTTQPSAARCTSTT